MRVEEARAHRPTDAVAATLARHPGASTAVIARLVGLTGSTADYHLRKLAKRGRASSELQGRERRWYPSGCGLCPVLRRSVPALRRQETLAVALTLGDWPTSASRIAQRAGVRVGEARWSVGVLERAGLVQRTASGRALLREGADLCLQKARTSEACALWGKCPVSKAFQQEPPRAEDGRASPPASLSRTEPTNPGHDGTTLAWPKTSSVSKQA